MEFAVWYNKCKNRSNIIAQIFFFNLFNTHIVCKVRKNLVTLRSKRRKNA